MNHYSEWTKELSYNKTWAVIIQHSDGPLYQKAPE